MAHLAIVCPPTPGHFNPLAVLGRVLQHRGHTVTVFQIPALADTAQAEGLDFQPVGDADTEALAEAVRSMAERSGLAAVRFAIQCSRRVSDLLCRELPDALRRSAVDLVLADQNEPAAATVAERLNLPFVSVCPGLPLNREPGDPAAIFWLALSRHATGTDSQSRRYFRRRPYDCTHQPYFEPASAQLGSPARAQA